MKLLLAAMATLAVAAESKGKYQLKTVRFSDGDAAAQEAKAAEEAKAAQEAADAKAAQEAKDAQEAQDKKDQEEAKKDAAYWEKEAREARRQAQNVRGDKTAAEKRAEAAEAELKKIEDGKKSDLQKAQEEAETARKEADAAKAEAKKARIESTAAKLGFNDPADAARLVDDKEVGANGENAEAALKKLLEAKPYLKGNGRAKLPDGGGKPPGGGNDEDKTAEARSRFSFLNRRMNAREADNGAAKK